MLKTSFKEANIGLFRQDPITEQMLAGALGSDLELSGRLLEDLGLKSLLGRVVRTTTVGARGLLGLRFAKTFAMIAYEGAAATDCSFDERQGLVAGCLFSILGRSHAINLGSQEDDDVFLIPLVESWMVSAAGKRMSAIARHIAVDIVYMGLPFSTTAGQRLSEHEKIVTDAFFMALGTGTEKDIQGRIYQYLNLRTDRFPTSRYDIQPGFFDWKVKDFDQYAKTYLGTDNLLEFQVYVPKTKWGYHRWFKLNYTSILRKVK